MPETGPFSVEIDIHGAYVVAGRSNLCSGCMSDVEVDAQIRLLKERLDRVAAEMKRKIKQQEGKPVL